MEKEKDILKSVTKVDLPAFLYTRILQKIQSPDKVTVPLYWKISWAATAVLILSLNIKILFSEKTVQLPSMTEDNTALQSSYVTAVNDIYNE